MTTYNPLNRLKDLAIICIPHTHKYYIPKYMTYHCIKYPRVHVFSVRVYPHRQFSVQWQLLWNFNNVMVEWIYKSFISKRTNLSPTINENNVNMFIMDEQNLVFSSYSRYPNKFHIHSYHFWLVIGEVKKGHSTTTNLQHFITFTILHTNIYSHDINHIFTLGI